MTSLTATFWKDSQGTCDCCGQTSKTIWGDLSDDEGTQAIYYVQWTVGSPQHFPHIDLIMGPWGEGTQASQRQLVCLRFRPSPNGGSFMVVDAGDRHHTKAELCGRGLRRDEVVGTPLAPHVFQLVDTLWLTEPRIEDIKALCTPLPPS
ncbi:hypothetical protein ACVC7V_19075 [Hydrogenophaga sp. A37]|uniref:hypothetical protein n=1 Tax=Hydrogenophaga sp. A37 TaxID=1945864 RepID=UPI000984CB63|nr:hypothetical protein [Hydrogenophaga sp. A37]OOG80536.1 hypothetical protein B0E41_20465 [Hydrogenophaga sp. A37]